MSHWGQDLSRVVLLVSISLLCSCVKPPRAKVVPAPARSSSASTVAKPRSRGQSATETKLDQAGRTLEQLISDPKNAIPDSILNGATCFAMFPAVASTDSSLTGFATCRNERGAWTSCAVATLSNATDERARGALLIFFLSARARQALLAGKVEFGERLAAIAGPMGSETPIVDQVELSQDAFAYLEHGNSLQKIALNKGSVTIDAPETARLYGHNLDVTELLDNSTMSSTVSSFFKVDVSSFFNTITPLGIILHHSVVIAAKALPDAEQAVDRFHYSRGFEISCFGKIYHIAYHYLILPNGEVRAGRPERCEGAHARGYNAYLGIALVGDFSSSDNPRGRKGPNRPTKAQIQSLLRLCRQLREKYNIPLQHIMPHSQVSRTECPGNQLEFGRILAALERQSSAGL